ncbi:hypothetical protein NSK_003019 [Nannochloropsis salina CCMP1776]|jgi:hypothetical protein|uniref:HMG box domain-containing protein n=1 Tax=Nannochloropsis salina CCMP1776 TaxID=1027361 RepID=A0A4D9DAE1_9STRA|nr:hypothetical protein NSK_003019 [Nannochloropsis salina CCMP1776]|eukprot:TFJ85509.1 hypothetical protein NSK_003019 [Nannochloropsis salina CCMP1776]
MPPKGVHAKKAAAMEKKAANESVKASLKAAAVEAQEAAAWCDGADLRTAKRKEEEERKAQARDAKKAELKALEEQENAMAASVKIKPKKVVNSKQAAKSNELKELEAQLKAMELEKKKKEEKKKAASADAGKKGKKSSGKKGGKDELSDDESLPPLEANVNRQMANVEIARGLDQAIDLLGSSRGGAGGDDAHPEKRQKAAYKAFEERMLAELKEEMPGMRLSQYKDRIFEMWKKSPENPMVAARMAAGMDAGVGKSRGW